jgi:hypothetical protein
MKKYLMRMGLRCVMRASVVCTKAEKVSAIVYTKGAGSNRYAVAGSVARIIGVLYVESALT